MKLKLAILCALLLALVCGAVAERSGNGIDTETLDALVVEAMEADAAVDETAAFEADVAEQNVEAEHAELSAEVAHDAATEFEWETQDEVEAAATAGEEDAAVDHAAEADVAATQEEEEEAEADAEADSEGASFLEADEEAEESEDSESEDESEAEADAEAEADEAAVLSATEKEQILMAQPLLEFEEDVMSEAADDAEDAEARAEEAAAESRFRSAAAGAAAAGTEYDEAVAKEMLVYAQAAYYEADPTACAAKLGHTGLRVQHTVATDLSDGATVFGLTAVDKSKQRIVVAFNGNVEPKELTAQLLKRKPLKVKSLCKSCKTHPYYVQAYRKVCPQITASVGMLLRKPALRKYQVWITGHGFGGALAALCGYEMEMSRVFVPANKRVFVTFGQPRVGNAHWARKFNQHFPQAVRVTHNDDPFPHVPPCHVDPTKRGTADEQTCFELKDRKKKLWAFHSPTQVWYPNEMPPFDSNEKGQFQRCDGVNWGEDPACRHHPLGVSIDDHRNYFGVDVTSHCANLLEPPHQQADI